MILVLLLALRFYCSSGFELLLGIFSILFFELLDYAIWGASLILLLYFALRIYYSSRFSLLLNENACPMSHKMHANTMKHKTH